MLLGCARPAPAVETAAAPASSARAAEDSSGLLAPSRLAALPAGERATWEAYVATSRRLRAEDQAAFRKELAAAGMTTPVRAPDARSSFAMQSWMTDAWFRTDTARRLAEAMLTYQTPVSGGWSKHVDFSKGPRRPGMNYFSETERWSYIATLDNNSTTSEIEFLGRALEAFGEPRYRGAALRGVEFLLTAQYPNGCWPQVYPLQGSYHDAATFNDDAAVNAIKVLRRVAQGELAYAPPETRSRADSAVRRGIECILAAQVVENGVRTGWGQQHDPLTLLPVAARSYELAGISGRESANVTEFLMTIPNPDARVRQAVHAAADWFRKTAIMDHEYDFRAGLTRKPGAGPIWARLIELGTGRPIFANRDGVKLYDWNQLTDRRTGYAWYSTEPGSALKKYEKWAAKHPR